MNNTVREFTLRIWALHALTEDSWAFLSAKDWDHGTWTDLPTPRRDGIIPFTIEYEHMDRWGYYPDDDRDVYFAPCLFSHPRRLRKYALPGRWLYADLDEVDPRTVRPIPTLAWQTSPGRYQAMWLLDRPLPPRRLEELNRKLTYFTGADKGGWSLTKVLRVPGSVSTKYSSEPFPVRMLKRTHPPVIHSAADLTRLLRDYEVPDDPADDLPTRLAVKNLPAYDDIYRRVRRRLTPRARQLLNTRTILESDDRSARMWELENLLLHDANLTPEQTFVLVRHSPWNKYRGQRREARALWAEIRKAAQAGPAVPRAKKPPAATAISPNGTPDRERIRQADLRDMDWRQFMHGDHPVREWMVEHMWTEGAYGIFAGEYKAYKTTILLDLMLSVASGEPFLGRYAVSPSSVGRVCYVFEEGRPGEIRDRTRRLAAHKGMWGVVETNPNPGRTTIKFDRELDIRWWPHPRLNLSDPASQERLSLYVARQQPKLLILETFYLLAAGLDENSQSDVAPVLEFLTRLSHEHETAIILSHHFHKPREESGHKRLLDRVSGTGVFGRWYESALFSERIGSDEDNTIRLSSSHRDGQGSSAELTITWDEKDDTNMTIVEAEVEHAAKPADLIELLKEQGTLAAMDAATLLGVTRQTIYNWADKSRLIESRTQTAQGKRQRVLSLTRSKTPTE